VSGFEGVFAILATPFDVDEELDDRGMRQLVEWEIEAGVHGLTALGIFGEAHRLTDDERARVIRVVVDQARGRVPVIVGVGHNSSKVAAGYARLAGSLGADGVMVYPSPFAKGPAAIRAYYAVVAAATDLPIIVQDEPTFTGVQLTPETLVELLSVSPNIRTLKLEEAPTPPKISAIRRLSDSYRIFGGLGGLYLLEELQRGAVGTMTGFAFPEILVEIYNAHRAGDVEDARLAFHRALPLLRYEGQQGLALALRKELLRARGAIPSATLRQPMRTLDATTLAELHELVQSLGLLARAATR
jgi:4-hydroxy-tetrahydrodipicolinate synthase